MHDAILVFLAQYVYILLLGLQSLNVNQRRYWAAGTVSALLGVLGFFLTSVIGDARNLQWTLLWWGFVASGPAGICTAIWIHPHLVRWFARR